jgi:hypothetical protein
LLRARLDSEINLDENSEITILSDNIFQKVGHEAIPVAGFVDSLTDYNRVSF